MKITGVPQTAYVQSCASTCTPSTTPGKIVICCQTNNCNTFTSFTLPPAIVTSCYMGGTFKYNNVLNISKSIVTTATVAPYNQYCRSLTSFDLTTTPPYSFSSYIGADSCVPYSYSFGSYIRTKITCCQTNNCNNPSSAVRILRSEYLFAPIFFLLTFSN